MGQEQEQQNLHDIVTSVLSLSDMPHLSHSVLSVICGRKVLLLLVVFSSFIIGEYQ